MAEQMVHTLLELLSGIQMKELIVFIISLIPTIELRGGIIAGRALGLDPIPTFIISCGIQIDSKKIF